MHVEWRHSRSNQLFDPVTPIEAMVEIEKGLSPLN